MPEKRQIEDIQLMETVVTETTIVPCTLVMRETKCDYCKKRLGIHYEFCFGIQSGIMVCADHVQWAKRDNAAFLHVRDFVRISTFIERFPDIKDKKINIPRSDGTITEGGSIKHHRREKDDGIQDEFVFLLKHNGEWKIPMQWFDRENTMEKMVSIDLGLSSTHLSRRWKQVSIMHST
jgi:hypothetical protein